jgi:hypothetical protein
MYVRKKTKYMANQALSIMKLRTLIRFKQEGRTHRFIGKSLGLSRTTVVKYVQFLEYSGLDWQELSSLDDHSLLTLCRSGYTDKADDRFGHVMPVIAALRKGIEASACYAPDAAGRIPASVSGGLRQNPILPVPARASGNVSKSVSGQGLH